MMKMKHLFKKVSKRKLRGLETLSKHLDTNRMRLLLVLKEEFDVEYDELSHDDPFKIFIDRMEGMSTELRHTLEEQRLPTIQ